jgi:hypothetical protein
MMKRSILGIFIFSYLFCLVFSCANQGFYIPSGQPLESIDFAAKIGQTPESAPYEIKNIFIDANLLYVTVQYQGSCSGKDVVEMIGDEIISDQMIPVRKVKLAIRSEDTSCKEYRNRTFVINIRELAAKKERDFETDLQIYGWRTKLRYVFIP